VASATAMLAAYRPALVLITGVAAIGMLVALSGLRSRRDLAADEAGELTAAGVVPAREFAKGGPSA